MKHIAFIFGVIVVMGIFFVEFQKISPQDLEIHVLETTNGDAILLRTPHGKNFLFDAGQDAKTVEKISEILPFWEKNIDAVFITHPDADHFFGIFPILERFSVQNIFLSGIIKDDPSFLAFFQKLEEKKISFHFLSAENDFETDGVVFDTLFPLQPIVGKISKEANQFSLVMRVSFENFSALFTGDSEQETEKLLLESGKNLKSTMLKVAHHGSKTSTTPEFLDAVNPSFAVISVGNNNTFGHPHEEVLDRFFVRKIPFFSNRNAAVVVKTDGTNTIVLQK